MSNKEQQVIDFINSIMTKKRTKAKLEVSITDYYMMLQGIRQLINEK